MIRKTLSPLPLVLPLFLLAFATPAFAQSQSWTSENAKYTIEAEFVQVKDDKVQLKKDSNGKLIWVELSKLSSDAQKQAKRLQEEADEKTGAAKSDKNLLKRVKLKCTAELKNSKFNNEDPQVVVSVIASGPPAAEAMRYGKIKLKKFVDEAEKKLTHEKGFSMNDITKSLEKVERDGFFKNHPEKCVAVEFKLPANVNPKRIGELSGTFSILTGGKRSIESISNLTDQYGKTLQSDLLKKAKLKIEVEKPPADDDSYTMSFNVSGNLDSLNRIWIGDAKQKALEAQQGNSNSSSGKSANFSFFFGEDVSKTAVLHIETVEGAVELKVPFEFSDIKVTGQ